MQPSRAAAVGSVTGAGPLLRRRRRRPRIADDGRDRSARGDASDDDVHEAVDEGFVQGRLLEQESKRSRCDDAGADDQTADASPLRRAARVRTWGPQGGRPACAEAPDRGVRSGGEGRDVPPCPARGAVGAPNPARCPPAAAAARCARRGRGPVALIPAVIPLVADPEPPPPARRAPTHDGSGPRARGSPASPRAGPPRRKAGPQQRSDRRVAGRDQRREPMVRSSPSRWRSTTAPWAAGMANRSSRAPGVLACRRSRALPRIFVSTWLT